MASFGENLRRERESRGVGLREVADTTKISLRFLQALEQDRVDILPGGIFRRAFVRQYARHLGLDAERLVAEFVYAHEEHAPPPPAVADRRGSGLRTALGVAAVLGAVALLLVLRPIPERLLPATSASSLAVVQPARTSDRVYPPPSLAPTPAPEGLVLTLAARQDCWVSARVDGRTVLERVLTGGERHTIEANGEIVLSVGNAGALQFTVNDRPGVPLGRSGEVRRGIVITRESLPSLVLDTPHSAAPPRS
jgi:cytoskeletal protein RodZ